jgi:hypothetical protein
LQAQLKTTQPITRSKFLIELAKPTQEKKLFLKNFNASKKIKRQHTADTPMIRKLNTDNGLKGRWIRTTGYN